LQLIGAVCMLDSSYQFSLQPFTSIDIIPARVHFLQHSQIIEMAGYTIHLDVFRGKCVDRRTLYPVARFVYANALTVCPGCGRVERLSGAAGDVCESLVNEDSWRVVQQPTGEFDGRQ
jgi:uncharacterized membrane protein